MSRKWRLRSINRGSYTGSAIQNGTESEDASEAGTGTPVCVLISPPLALDLAELDPGATPAAGGDVALTFLPATGRARVTFRAGGFDTGDTRFADLAPAATALDLRRRRWVCNAIFFWGVFDDGRFRAFDCLRSFFRTRFSSFFNLAWACSRASSDSSAWPSAFRAAFFVDLAIFRACLSFTFAARAVCLAVSAAF